MGQPGPGPLNKQIPCRKCGLRLVRKAWTYEQELCDICFTKLKKRWKWAKDNIIEHYKDERIRMYWLNTFGNQEKVEEYAKQLIKVMEEGYVLEMKRKHHVD